MKITRLRVFRREFRYVGGTYMVGATGTGGATVIGGHLIAPDVPGLGVVPAWDELGDPVAEYT